MVTLQQLIREFSVQMEMRVNEHAPVLAALLIAGLLLRCFRVLRQAIGIAVIGMSVGLILGAADLLSLVTVSLSVFTWVNMPLPRLADRQRQHALRWRWSITGIVGLTGIFIVQQFQTEGATVSAVTKIWHVALDMLLYLRLASFLWEFGAGRIQRPAGIKFIAWCLLPFTRFGPVLRYSEWQRQIEQTPQVLQPLNADWLIRCSFAVGKLLLAVLLPVLGVALQQSGGKAGLLLVLYSTSPWSWYLNAAGLADFAILTGQLGGIAIPPNYARPFEARNLGDFWARWNMSATAIFRETLFYNRWGLRTPNLYLNSMIVFLLVGMWHAINPYWMLWGLLHGIGFCVFIAWKQWRGPTAVPLPFSLGWALTYFFVCSCWALPPQLIKLCHRLVAC